MQRRAYPVPVSLPSLARLGSADLFIPLMLLLAVVLPLLLAFLGVGIRRDLGTPLVLNEVFVNPADPSAGAWVELYNNTDAPMAIDGWRLGTAGADIAQLHGSVPPGDYVVLRTPAVWSPASDAVILRAADGTLIDSVNWGPAPDRSPILHWSKSAARAPAANQSLVRNPQGLDSDTPKDWLPTQPTPGAQSPASLSVGMYRLLFDITNYVTMIAGFILWGAFILIGLIARRFEILTSERTFWGAMLIAPIGIVIYNLIQSYAFFTAGRMTECKAGLSLAACQQGWSFLALFVSAAAMAIVVYRFYVIARRILEV
jgi:hypothetical protein